MKRVFIVILCLLSLPGVAARTAQVGSQVYVQTTTATPIPVSADGVPALKVISSFSLLDNSGLPMSGEIDHIELRVGQDRYTASFAKASGDWGISILIDTSGTMAGSADYKRMIDGISKSLDRMPDNALFTVLTFDNSVNFLQDFTRDKDEVRKKLQNVNARSGAKACLNDGLMEAVRRVERTTAHTAVFVITASEDGCGNTSLQAVVDEAVNGATQIHMLGINGFSINLATLEKYTTPSHGLAYMRSPNDLIFGLGSLFFGLANQWQATWTIYPPKGEQTSDMTVFLKDTTTLGGKITYISDQAYEPPPKIELIGEIRTTPASVLVNLNIVNAAKIVALQARIIDKLTGRPRLDQQLPKVQDTLSIPASTLENNGQYTLLILALDAQNNTVSQTQPRDFQFKPTPLQIGITQVTVPTLLSPNFLVTVTVPSGGVTGIARYKVWLESGGSQSGGVIPETEVLQSPDALIQIPAGDLPSGEYQVKAQALDGANQILAEVTKPFQVVYNRPSFLDRVMHDFGQSTFAVVALLVVALLAFIGLFVLIRVTRSRSRVAVQVVEPALPQRKYQPIDGPSRVVVQPEVQSQSPQQAYSRPAPPSVPAQPQPGARALATLTGREPATLRLQLNVTAPSFTLGRSAENMGPIPLDPQSGVSGKHAVLLLEQGAWYIQDSNSRNGTYVNGQKIASGARARLADRAIIGLGPNVKLEFHIL